MATKKKSDQVVYTPITPVQDITGIIEQKIDQIPPYEDAGVSYKGKYKVQKTASQYELKAQQYRYYHEQTGGGDTGFIIRSNYQNSIFYCKTIILTWYWGAGINDEIFKLYNGYYIAGGVDPQLDIKVSRAQRGNTIVIELPVPIKFSAQLIGFNCGASGAAGDYMDFTLIGWDEQI